MCDAARGSVGELLSVGGVVTVVRLEPAGGQFGAGPTFGAGSMVLLSASALDSSLAGGQAKRPQHDPQAASMAWHKHDHLVLMDKSKSKRKLY